MNYGDRIFEIIQMFNKRASIPDLHSFVADIQNGKVFVECRGYEIMIESRVYTEEGNEIIKTWCGSSIAAANRLEMLEINLDTITC